MAATVAGLPDVSQQPPISVTGLPSVSAPPIPLAPAPAPAGPLDFTTAPSYVLPLKEDESKKLKPWQIVLIILAGLLILGAGGYFLYLKLGPPSKIIPPTK
jgi:hypothetical protein